MLCTSSQPSDNCTMTAHSALTMPPSNIVTTNQGRIPTPDQPITNTNKTSKRQDDQSTTKAINRRRAIHIRRQQERILLLRHAVKCKLTPGNCANPLCHKMKLLTKHMTLCRGGQSCKYPHCASSKALLSHYSRCSKKKTSSSGNQCLICQPVRGFILREKVACNSMNSVMSDFSQISM
jgi:E1A/CREB-binding protein